ncbi:uncharacterized protein (DUF433 family) [Pseudomonas sp. PvR086]|jgi:uncharacterized protein (DUF433 family)|uniref:DUF433 domain-containing protein n=1 Tax=Pseudomonas TaxID=286 RepID=UPI00037733A0|nr:MULTISPECIES: DUF433 domain-containing protein [Pseudomonas]MBD9608582.1 DUF433 domain-containing protein [Pseudomonas sp. PDM08]MBD9619485.1 DUF433 domain-containing protein [Pseudomonas sp. PDM07]MDR7108297.1 uncharacterized protein (DUF433 family) [Pseudomonas frederiksbergensis]PMY44784.1 DUF433 domain-containing protein [Pseudomonas sp. FW305-53]PMY83404.1 DUF433 domain-containing protein [Pseudomonas sp. FW303-C2]
MQNIKLPSRLVGIGLYTPAEASLYTGISATDIRRWLFGYTAHGVQHPGLWDSELSDVNECVLGFHDLLEIRFVHAFRQHGVSLQAIRSASQQAKELFNQAYPFTCKRFQTDGRSIFATVMGETGDEALLDLIKRQYAFEQVIKPSLYEGIDYTGSGSAQRWYPVKRSKAIVLDPSRNFGKPVLSGTGIDTAAIFSAYRAEGRDVKRVARLYEIPIAAVEAAVSFEQRNAA